VIFPSVSVSSFCCFDDYYLLRCFHIARHLAAKFGTRLAAFLYRSSLLWVDDSHLGVTLLSLLFSVICYFHQIVMISVIKLCRVVGLADLHGVNV
jgi:hypothetical protein